MLTATAQPGRREADAQRLRSVVRVLRKVARNVDRHAALPAGQIAALHTLATDCQITLNLIAARLATIQPLETTPHE